MKRRLSIAISLIGSPKCLILWVNGLMTSYCECWRVYRDEPTTGLDPDTRRYASAPFCTFCVTTWQDDMGHDTDTERRSSHHSDHTQHGRSWHTVFKDSHCVKGWVVYSIFLAKHLILYRRSGVHGNSTGSEETVWKRLQVVHHCGKRQRRKSRRFCEGNVPSLHTRRRVRWHLQLLHTDRRCASWQAVFCDEERKEPARHSRVSLPHSTFWSQWDWVVVDGAYHRAV